MGCCTPATNAWIHAFRVALLQQTRFSAPQDIAGASRIGDWSFGAQFGDLNKDGNLDWTAAPWRWRYDREVEMRPDVPGHHHAPDPYYLGVERTIGKIDPEGKVALT
jgi:hypothetical protein